MVTIAQFRKAALALPHAIEKPHFDRASFRVDAPRGTTICTLLESDKAANFPLTLDMQEMVCESEPDIFYPVAGKWGEKGWTTMKLDQADKETLDSILRIAWHKAAPKKLHGLMD